MAAKTPAPPPPPAPVAAAVPPAPAPAPVTAAGDPLPTTSLFNYDDALPIPAGRSFGGNAGQSSETMTKLSGQPIGKSFLEAVAIGAEVTDPKERQKLFNEECKRIVNRIGGAIRRLRKTPGNEVRNYAIRKVADTDLGYGVRVWREADTASA